MFITDYMKKRAKRDAVRENKLDRILLEGATLAQEMASDNPSATIGVLAEGFPEWKPDTAYNIGQLFVYEGAAGFARIELTSSTVYPPFSTGTEALYGVRPIPDEDGVYPYTYNMAASLGMRVRDGNKVYVCIQPIDPMLYPPSAIPAHFEEE